MFKHSISLFLNVFLVIFHVTVNYLSFFFCRNIQEDACGDAEISNRGHQSSTGSPSVEKMEIAASLMKAVIMFVFNA